MLDSPTTVAMNTDIPLFGFKIHHPSSSSCGMEAALVIQRPTPEESFFSWSDFPMVVEESPSYHTTSASSSSPSFDDDSSSSLSPSSSSPSSPSSSASLCSLASSSCSSNSSSTTSLESTNANTVSRKRRQENNSNYNNNKNVRFSQHLQVRTYNLVLGDHPLCNDGLAIEMGWDYDSEQGENIDLQLHEDCKFHPGVQGYYGGYYHPQSSSNSNNNNFRSNSQRRTRKYNNTFSCSRRSHLDRKRLLLEVAGCTTEELEDRTNTYQEQLHKLQKQQYVANDI